MEKTIIEIKNLTKSFGANRAVDGIDFSVENGSFFAFLGRRGGRLIFTLYAFDNLV